MTGCDLRVSDALERARDLSVTQREFARCCGPSVAIREASGSDAAAIARVYIETARVQYAGIVDNRILSSLSAPHLAHRWEILLTTRRWLRAVCVAVSADGHVVGFAAAGQMRGSCATAAAELRAIYVLPACQRRGVGRSLFTRTVETLARLGFATMIARVFVANPARAFFASLGGIVHMTSGDGRTEQVIYAWSDLVAFASLEHVRHRVVG
jgi:L-amino acid N-acyltransferase YncA